MPSRGEILSLGHDVELMAKRHALLREAGYNVVSAINPLDGLKLMATRKFDVLIVGCFEESECRALEEAGRKQHTPVVSLCCQPPNAHPTTDKMSCQDAVIHPGDLLAKINLLLSSASKSQAQSPPRQVPAD